MLSLVKYAGEQVNSFFFLVKWKLNAVSCVLDHIDFW